MMARNHVAVSTSVVVTVLVSKGANVSNLVVPFIGTSIGALIVDIDHPNSMISRLFPWTAKVISKLTPHRGFLHSWILLLAWYVMYLLDLKMDQTAYILLFYVGIGMALHIVEDFFSERSLPIFYPYSLEEVLNFLKRLPYALFGFKSLRYKAKKKLRKKGIVKNGKKSSSVNKKASSGIRYVVNSKFEDRLGNTARIITLLMVLFSFCREYLILK